MKKHLLVILSALLILLSVFGCSSKNAAGPASAPGAPQYQYDTEGKSADSDANFAAPQPAPSAVPAEKEISGTAADTGSSAVVPDANRKMIWNGEMELETLEFDAAVRSMEALIKKCGGFIQSSAVTGEGRDSSGKPRLRNARYTIRIPSENFQLFMKSSGNVATVIYSNTGAQDVTAYYFDTEAHLKVLNIKEERLLAMLEAAEKMNYADQLQYILQIENELSSVRYEIESLTGTLRRYDDLISYSTVTAYLNEVEAFTATPKKPETLGQRISAQFTESLTGVIAAAGDLTVWVIGNSPTLIILILIGVGVYYLVRAVRSRRRTKKGPPPPPVQ